MAVKLYITENLREVKGLYTERALAKMNGDMEIYSTLLDKFLNQLPRSISKLRKYVREPDTRNYLSELKALCVDLADIFALDILDRANMLCQTAEKGESERCVQQLEPFIQAAQEFAYEVKQCRTQDAIENEDEAASKAAEMDIGGSMMKNKYAALNKSKFVDLYKRIDAGLTDKAINLTNVLKAMGYDAAISKYLYDIDADLSQYRIKHAQISCGRLLTLLGCDIPESVKKFTLLIVDSSRIERRIENALGSGVMVLTAVTKSEAAEQAAKRPDFILVNRDVCGGDGVDVAKRLKTAFPDIPMGLMFLKAGAQDILNARQAGAAEIFLLPLDEAAFAEKMKRYMQ